MKRRLSFQVKLFLSLVLFSCLLLALLGTILFHFIDRQLHHDLGQRARVQASEIALMPGLAEKVARRDIAGIAALIQPLRNQSDASYIVIGDTQEQHLYHSESPERLNLPMIGGDNAEVLQGKTIISVRKGGIGVSLRSKAPIFNTQHQVIGIVSVGYLTSYIANINVSLLWQASLYGVALLLLLFIFSWMFSRNLKKQMFWLEPKDIALLVLQQKALLEAMYEGVFAVNAERQLILINRAARELLDIQQSESELLGKPLDQVLQIHPAFLSQHEVKTHDHITVLNQRQVIVNRVAIELEPGEPGGWVCSFRDKNDINTLSSQLSQVKRYADNLRIMRHEQLNWTATLVGLLQMQRYDDAMRYIHAQSAGAQQVLDFVSARFTSPALCGLLLGKYVSAREKGVELKFDPACQLSRIPAALSETALMSVIGNLLDNAVDATLNSRTPATPVELYISGRNQELLIEVADQGCGIDDSIKPHLFEQGVTSKPNSGDDMLGAEHGIGLYLAAGYVQQAGGSIEISDNSPQGTIFSVFIPFHSAALTGLSHE
ncbi:two-component system, CitB family, cit operon sensor histidine kinase CitA [Candidatus Pantoea symbiotica]|jgi:two-component system cit operon sensor histidine kinase CitA|uniref:histidine kinase n=1 Tax=Candidatus Pantoea symbiotica TaxID=1884370 RepID=A0A1I4E5L8_9GAMM|nr:MULTISPECIES: sensor histidine kinase [Pantoea]KAJ9434083.1 sensor histidine kinase [Pantoea sp. YR343]MRT26083.1 GHKL domain-containing protein [Enterobacteriaceae bacterium RIT697]SFL00230.1 two-component system, CitB family, cit operon sensor histidine kinase CitA [Pantoea symbiotica]SFV07196.1 two-component system, CitB family, cit operon sensor histidine kinase CitA [Pantoea sp. YR525]